MEVDSKQVARNKIKSALYHIDMARFQLSQACGELCPIVGAFDQWRIVGDAYDQVKGLWHLVDSIPRESVDLDPDAKRSLKEKMEANK
jgi:hypothetical protein